MDEPYDFKHEVAKALLKDALDKTEPLEDAIAAYAKYLNSSRTSVGKEHWDKWQLMTIVSNAISALRKGI